MFMIAFISGHNILFLNEVGADNNTLRPRWPKVWPSFNNHCYLADATFTKLSQILSCRINVSRIISCEVANYTTDWYQVCSQADLQQFRTVMEEGRHLLFHQQIGIRVGTGSDYGSWIYGSGTSIVIKYDFFTDCLHTDNIFVLYPRMSPNKVCCPLRHPKVGFASSDICLYASSDKQSYYNQILSYDLTWKFNQHMTSATVVHYLLGGNFVCFWGGNIGTGPMHTIAEFYAWL